MLFFPCFYSCDQLSRVDVLEEQELSTPLPTVNTQMADSLKQNMTSSSGCATSAMPTLCGKSRVHERAHTYSLSKSSSPVRQADKGRLARHMSLDELKLNQPAHSKQTLASIEDDVEDLVSTGSYLQLLALEVYEPAILYRMSLV